MPYKDPNAAKAYQKAYYLKNRDKAIINSKIWRESHKDQRNQTERKRNAERRREDPDFREYRKSKSKESYEKHREKRILLAAIHNTTQANRARQMVRNAIRNGIIDRPSVCSKCGSSDNFIQAHHEDYSKPLDIIWLCVFCHGMHHQLNSDFTLV